MPRLAAETSHESAKSDRAELPADGGQSADFSNPHIQLERVDESAVAFREPSGVVEERVYPQMGHTVNGDELDAARTLLAADPDFGSICSWSRWWIPYRAHTRRNRQE
jgi:hypothetical protein